MIYTSTCFFYQPESNQAENRMLLKKMKYKLMHFLTDSSDKNILRIVRISLIKKIIKKL